MIRIPQTEGLATATMNRVFSNTAATYKFYWLLSLLDMHVREQQTVMAALDVASRMVAYVWYPFPVTRATCPPPKGGVRGVIPSKQKY